MKTKLKDISSICKLIFGYGIMLCLFVGGLTFFGYMVAFIFGGTGAEAICTFIYKQIVPIMIYTSTVLILFGLLSMYLAGETALTPDKKKVAKEKSKK